MRNVYIYGDSLLKATVPDEELKYHFHLPEIMARYPSDRVQVTNRAKMGATVSKGLSLVEHDAQRGLDADYALICYGTPSEAMFSAMSSTRPTMRDTFTPGAGASS